MNDNYDRTAEALLVRIRRRRHEKPDARARNWWLVALRGVFALIFGIIAILLPGVTITALVLLFVAYMLVDGIFAIIAGVRAARRHERWGLLIVEGIADLVAGGIAIVWPLITIVAFIYLLAAWAIVSGGLAFAAALRLQLEHGRWLLRSADSSR